MDPSLQANELEAFRQTVEQEMRSRKSGSAETREDGVPVLGGLMTVSPSLATLINAGVSGVVIPRIRGQVGDYIRTYGESALKPILRSNAHTTANVVAHGAEWAMTFYNETAGVVRNIQDYRKSMTGLAQQMEPLLAAHNLSVSAGALRSYPVANNEVVMVARKQLSNKLYRDLQYTAADLITDLPSAMSKLEEDAKRKSNSKQEKTGVSPAEKRKEIRDKAIAIQEEKRAWERGIEEAWTHSEIAKHTVDDKLFRIREIEESATSYNSMFRNYAPRDPQKRVIPYDVENKDSVRLWEDAAMRSYKDEFKAEQRKVREQEERQRAKESKEEKPLDWMKNVLTPMGALGTTMYRERIDSEYKEGKVDKTAFDMIKKLADKLEDNPRLNNIDGKPLAGYIEDIFNQHQMNMKQHKVGERLHTKFKAAAEAIATALTDGVVHPQALIHLVGDRKIVLAQGKDVASIADVHTAINEVAELMPAKYYVDADSYLGENVMTEQDIKGLLNDLKGPQRDFFASLLPDDVLKRFGFKDIDIFDVRQRTEATFAGNLRQVLLDIATQPDEVLREAKYKDEEIKKLRDAAPKLQKDGLRSQVAAVSSFVAPRGEFKEGLAWLAINHVEYWKKLSRGEMQVGDMYKQAGEKLYSKEEKKREHHAANDDAPEEEHTRGTSKSFAERVGKKDSTHRGAVASLHDRDDEYDVFANDNEDDMPGKSVRHAESHGAHHLNDKKHART